MISEEVRELIRRYDLKEDPEHVIIRLPDKDGRARRCFILKRNFLRLQFPDGHVSDYPLSEIIEATVKYPDLPLSEVLHFVHKNPEESAEGRNYEDSNIEG